MCTVVPCRRLINDNPRSRGNMNNKLSNFKTGYGVHRFGKCLFCGKYHLHNSFVFCYAKCFKCDKMGYFKVCKTAVPLTAINTMLCNLDPNNLCNFSNHIVFLFTTSNI